MCTAVYGTYGLRASCPGARDMHWAYILLPLPRFIWKSWIHLCVLIIPRRGLKVVELVIQSYKPLVFLIK